MNLHLVGCSNILALSCKIDVLQRKIEIFKGKKIEYGELVEYILQFVPKEYASFVDQLKCVVQMKSKLTSLGIRDLKININLKGNITLKVDYIRCLF